MAVLRRHVARDHFNVRDIQNQSTKKGNQIAWLSRDYFTATEIMVSPIPKPEKLIPRD